MAIPWIIPIKRKKQLSVYTGSSLGAWAGIVKDAIREFNTLSQVYKLGVTLTQASVPSTSTGGADVSVQAVNGSASFNYDGETRAGSFSGTGLHGLTYLFSRDGGLEKAAVFLPSQPQVNTPQAV